MTRILLILLIGFVPLVQAEPTEKAKRVAAVTCAIMAETRNMDAAIRVEKMNEARDKIGGEPFLRGDFDIREALEWGLCQELVLNETYDESLQLLKDAKRERKRIAAAKRAEEERIAAEKRAEENRIAAEKQRIADSKPSVKENYYPNGQLKSEINYQAKNDGGKQHGLSRKWHSNGHLRAESTFKSGKLDGEFKCYNVSGEPIRRGTVKEGKAKRWEGFRKNKWRKLWRSTLQATIDDGWFSDACLAERNGNSCC